VYLAVVLDAFSRKVVGWELDKTLAVRLALAALNRALTERKPGPGLVHHSDRGLQYASTEYVDVLRQHQMIPSMSRPANPYDNASCESFMKTLKREEIYANRYEDLGHMRVNIEEFIEQYYNRQRLHSALGYRSPEEFEQQAEPFWVGREHHECNPCVFQTMTKPHGKFSWGGCAVAPFCRSPASWRSGKQNPKAASVPKDFVSL
jgi:hypothetical protein